MRPLSYNMEGSSGTPDWSLAQKIEESTVLNENHIERFFLNHSKNEAFQKWLKMFPIIKIDSLFI